MSKVFLFARNVAAVPNSLWGIILEITVIVRVLTISEITVAMVFQVAVLAVFFESSSCSLVATFCFLICCRLFYGKKRGRFPLGCGVFEVPL